jgi:hypothetical protein
MTPQPFLPLTSFKFRTGSRVEIINRRQLETKLIRECLKDASFKEQFKNDPKNTIAQFLDVVLPQSLSVAVVEESQACFYMVIPCNPYSASPQSATEQPGGQDLPQFIAWMMDQQRQTLLDDKNKNVELILRAWTDPDFKRFLTNEPKLAIQHVTGEDFEIDAEIEVLEETPDQIFIVLPYLEEFAEQQIDIDANFINMGVVIGSHANTDTGSCDTSNPVRCFGDAGDTHPPNLGCQGSETTLCDSQLCRDLSTQTPGYFGCGL